MPAEQAAVLIVIGVAFIALGLISGPLARLRDALQRFSGAFSPMPMRVLQPSRGDERLTGQGWLAVGGAVVVIAVL